MTFEKYHNIMPFLSFYYVVLFITQPPNAGRGALHHNVAPPFELGTGLRSRHSGTSGQIWKFKAFLIFQLCSFCVEFSTSFLSIARRGRVTFFLLMLSGYYCLSLDSSHSSAENPHTHTDTMRFGSSLTSTQNHCSGDNKRSTRSSFERA